MGLIGTAVKTAGRARYAAAQGLRSAWYGAQMRAVRRQTTGLERPGETPFQPTRGKPDMTVLRRAYFELFIQDRQNVEAGLYPGPRDFELKDLPRALKSARAFRLDAAEVDRRRVARDASEICQHLNKSQNRYPDYYLQNFHYQTGGWFTEDSAELYDTQVEALFTGTADAMRRAVLAEVSRELRGRDHRRLSLLDVGCGNGRFLSQVLDVYPRLRATGLDLSPSYTEAARIKLKPWKQVEVMHEAAEAMPMSDATRDIVVSIFLFHELPPHIRGRVIAEVQRVLKPGGLFILADSAQFGDYPELDGLLEYFPHSFHEPYYDSYLSWDAEKACNEVGLTHERRALAFLTHISVFRKDL